MILPTQKMSMNILDQQLNRLTQVVNDRSDKLMALETMLLQNQLSRKLLPSIPPVNVGWYSSNFGWRIDPFQRNLHPGKSYTRMHPPARQPPITGCRCQVSLIASSTRRWTAREWR